MVEFYPLSMLTVFINITSQWRGFNYMYKKIGLSYFFYRIIIFRVQPFSKNYIFWQLRMQHIVKNLNIIFRQQLT